MSQKVTINTIPSLPRILPETLKKTSFLLITGLAIQQQPTDFTMSYGTGPAPTNPYKQATSLDSVARHRQEPTDPARSYGPGPAQTVSAAITVLAGFQGIVHTRQISHHISRYDDIVKRSQIPQDPLATDRQMIQRTDKNTKVLRAGTCNFTARHPVTTKDFTALARAYGTGRIHTAYPATTVLVRTYCITQIPRHQPYSPNFTATASKPGNQTIDQMTYSKALAYTNRSTGK